VTLQSFADIVGKAINTNGALDVNSAGDTTLGDANSAALNITTPKSVKFNTLTLVTAADFAAGQITIGELKQKPGLTTPLEVSMTGYRGGVGTFASVFIDTPNEVLIPRLYETNATISTSSPLIVIRDGYVTQTMGLTTPYETLWLDNTTPRPVLGNDVQLYQPTLRFDLVQGRYATLTNAYIVQYGLPAEITDRLGAGFYFGASLARDIDRMGDGGDPWEQIDLDDAQDQASVVERRRFWWRRAWRINVEKVGRFTTH